MTANPPQPMREREYKTLPIVWETKEIIGFGRPLSMQDQLSGNSDIFWSGEYPL